MKAKVILFLVVFTVFILGFTSNNVLAQSTSNQSSNLSIEIYTRDDKSKKPASKTRFYLLDAEIETLLSKAGLEEIQPWDLVDTYAMERVKNFV